MSKMAMCIPPNQYTRFFKYSTARSRCMNKDIIYGKGHTKGRNPHFSEQDPVVGGVYVKPKSVERQFLCR